MKFSNELSFSWNFPAWCKLSQETSQRVYMRARAMGNQSPTSTTSSQFWQMGSHYEREMGPKTKTNTHELTEFSLVLTLVYLAIKVSDTNTGIEQIHSSLSKTVFQSSFVCATNSQTTALVAWTGLQYVCNLVLFHVSVWGCNLYGFLQVEAMASTLLFSTIAVAGHVRTLGFPGNIGQTWLSLCLFWQTWSKWCHFRPLLSAWVQP